MPPVDKPVSEDKNINKAIVETIANKIVGEEQKQVKEKEKKISINVLERYNIDADASKIEIQIRKKGTVTEYYLEVPKISVATTALLKEVRDELVTAATIGMNEILDPKAIKKMRARFLLEAVDILKEKLPHVSDETKNLLVNKLIQDMLGLGKIEFLLNDINLEEIVIPSSKEPVRAYHKKYGWLPTNLRIEREDEIINYANIIARRVGRQITVLKPLLDAHLVSGDRVNAILYPISSKGNTITIRKFARDPYTIIDLIQNKTVSIDLAVLLWIAFEYEMNVIVSGGTASGKTVLLNACMPFMPPNHRIISVEDTRELMLPEFLYWCPLVTRTPNPEGKGGVSMLDLLVNSLRMRPDRIILGEMRRQEEAMVMFEAMHTGHSVYATLHANTVAETLSRLTNPPLSIPENLLAAVNLNVVMFRDRRRGIRRAYQVGEFRVANNKAEAIVLYRWVADQDKIVKHSESSKLFEEIGRNTGMSRGELNKNMMIKKQILELLVKKNVRSLAEFGKITNLYYSDLDLLMKHIKKNDVKSLLER